ncbi:MAG: cytochrome c biogenesis protein CcsA [Elusimicrobia bacterium]|nr:cytochrome c biogenesis protein CcsA [Elusimicrobiota bacterium]
MNAQTVLGWAAFGLYAAATFAAFGYLFSKDSRASRMMLALLVAGVVLHAAGFAARTAAFWAFPENRFFLPVSSYYGALSYMALALAGVFLAVEGRKRLGILGAFVLPWATLALGAAVAFARPDAGSLEPNLRSYWLNLHPLVLMTAYAALANAFGVGVALLVQERQIKSRKPGELCYRLPSLDELDALNGRVIAFALPLLLLGLGMGLIWSYRVWGSPWAAEPKEILALVTAGIYGIFLWLRYGAGQRGRRPVLVSMGGFVLLLATFFGAELMSGRHGYLGGR